jgi:catechol 2,3-dioxygenase-like lactoylglutathione lyase family enzyme
MIDRFDHLHLYPANFDRSLAFYRDTLGWTVVDEWNEPVTGRGAALSSGAIKIVLSERTPPEAPAGVGRPCIHLDIHDVDKRFQLLPPGDHVVADPRDSDRGSRCFVVRDPDGNLIAFEEVNRHRG